MAVLSRTVTSSVPIQRLHPLEEGESEGRIAAAFVAPLWRNQPSNEAFIGRCLWIGTVFASLWCSRPSNTQLFVVFIPREFIDPHPVSLWLVSSAVSCYSLAAIETGYSMSRYLISISTYLTSAKRVCTLQPNFL